MTMYEPGNAQHEDYLARHRAAWTPEREAAMQAEFKRQGVGKYRKDKVA